MMNGIFDSTNSAHAEVIDDDYVIDRCNLVEAATVEAYGLSRDHFRSICIRNISRLPGRTGAPEKQVVEAGLTLMATALRLKMVHENTIAKDPAGWRSCEWVVLD
jgi:hypothetical protein